MSNPRLRGGANGESLFEAQLEVLKEHPLEIEQVGEFKRDPRWRPLTLEETEIKEDAPTTGMDYFKEAGKETPEYYWLE